MIYGMYLSTMGAQVQSARHGTIANNLANTTTDGFKPETQVMKSLPAESVLQGMGRRQTDDILEKIGGGVWLDKTTTNFSRGAIKLTGNPLNVAIKDMDGDPVSFFQTQKPGGTEVHYTRNGNFAIDSDGYLTTTGGEYVLDTNGGPIQLDAGDPGATIAINSSGQVIRSNGANQVLLGEIGVVQTDQPHLMKKVGDNQYIVNGPVALVPSDATLQDGGLEGSAVVAVTEMTNMIEAHRVYESNMNFLKMQDETLGSVVSRLGRVV